MICGTQKGGTTTLQSYLSGHPEICMAGIKGTHFFDTEEYFSKGEPDYSIYQMQFQPSAEHVRIGEATPIYMYWEPAMERIRDYNPNMQLIVLLRNPITRAHSNWNMSVEKGHEKLSFSEGLKMEEERINASKPLQNRRFSYVDRGFYSRQLKHIWKFIPKDQVLVLKSEEFYQDPRRTLDQACDFLQVSRFKEVIQQRKNARVYESEISDQEWNKLKVVFEAEIGELERLLGWDCSDWMKRRV